MSKVKFILGGLKNLFNSNISCLAFVSSNNDLDKKAVIYRGVKIKGSKVGAYSYISPNTEVENAEIGKFCSIADHCRIGMGTHNINQISTSPIFTQKVNGTKTQWINENVHDSPLLKVKLGNDVWVGSRAMILGGVTVSDGAVIGAGAIVTKNVPAYAVVGGVPAKIIKYRFSEKLIEKLIQLEWWNCPEISLKEHITLFQKRNISEDEIILMMKAFNVEQRYDGNQS